MTDADQSQQASLETAANGEHDDAVVELDDERGTTLREGDVLADTRTDEKLVVLGFDEEVGSIEYYSNYEGSEGLHDTAHLSSCFDAVFRSCNGGTEVISLTPA
jgi:hypothetical protein